MVAAGPEDTEGGLRTLTRLDLPSLYQFLDQTVTETVLCSARPWSAE